MKKLSYSSLYIQQSDEGKLQTGVEAAHTLQQRSSILKEDSHSHIHTCGSWYNINRS